MKWKGAVLILVLICLFGQFLIHLTYKEEGLEIHESVTNTKIPKKRPDKAHIDTSLTKGLEKRTFVKPIPAKDIFVNPHNFKYIINEPNLCKTKVDIIIFVHSATGRFTKRNLIRSTWGNVSKFQGWNIRTVFMLGRSKNVSQDLILDESKKFHDIIQEDFVDHYRNLTYKHIMALKWIKDFCKSAKYIVKIDEDIIVNVFNVVKYAQSLDKMNAKKSMYCSVFEKQMPRRDKKDKWFVSKEEYFSNKYPRFCGGFFYLMTKDLINPLYKESLKLKYFWIDDVYVTGLLTQKLKTGPQSFIKPYTFERNIYQWKSWRIKKTLLFIHIDNKDKKELWKKLWNEIKNKKLYLT